MLTCRILQSVCVDSVDVLTAYRSFGSCMMHKRNQLVLAFFFHYTGVFFVQDNSRSDDIVEYAQRLQLVYVLSTSDADDVPDKKCGNQLYRKSQICLVAKVGKNPHNL